MIWYIYSLTDPRDNRVRYVGKTNNIKIRLRGHVSRALQSLRRNHRLNWIRSVVESGQMPQLSILESGEGDWRIAEKKWIKNFRDVGYALVNGTDGGEGMENPTPETRAKISAKTKAAMASPEARAKLLALRASPEYRARMSAAAKIRLAVPEARAKYAAAIKKQWQNPECRAKHLVSIRGYKPSLETLAKNSAAAKAVWAARKAKTS